tara:strand:- start:202 stop:576 length:375 start_codon:yes stop_codon:yes gene_type:complete
MTRENLSTAGNEFLLPNGKRYTGKYHIHVSKGAMVGATHSEKKHDSLRALTIAVHEKVKSIQVELKAAQQHEEKIKPNNQRRAPRVASTPTPRRTARRTIRQAPTPTPTPTPTPSSGGGGGGGY